MTHRYHPTDFTIAQLAERLNLKYDLAREVILAAIRGGGCKLISGERKVRHYAWVYTNKLAKETSL